MTKAAKIQTCANAPPKDYSWLELGCFKEVLSEEPRSQAGDPKKSVAAPTRALKLNNNKFSTWEGFGNVVAEISDAQNLHWVDLSFNSLTTIDEVITSFPTLCTLYLHANAIKHLSELDKLSKLEHLKSLTLHGNPIESDNQTPASKERYRNKIISMLPRLAKLDFTPVTKLDREKAMIWRANKKRRAQNKAKK